MVKSVLTTNGNTNELKNNISISSLLSPHVLDSGNNTDNISDTNMMSPSVKNGTKDPIVIDDEEDDVILVGDSKLSLPPVILPQQRPQLPQVLPVQRKSTKVSLMSMMNSDNSTTISTPPPQQLPMVMSPQIITANNAKIPSVKEEKPKLARKPRARKTLTPAAPLDLSTTIIIDGKPVVIPTMGSTVQQPPKKKAKKEPTEKKPKLTTTTTSAKKVTKPKQNNTNNKKEDVKVAVNGVPLATIPANTTPKLQSPSPLNGKPLLTLAAKLIKRGPKLKSETSNSKSATPTNSVVAPALPLEPKPLVTLPLPKLADVKPVEPAPAQQPDLDRMDPLSGKKNVEPAIEEPIISLHLPLTSPDLPPGSAQVIFNITKLCEDKYGWKLIHPGAKFAMDELNEDDDDIDDMEDDDEELDEQEKMKREQEKEKEKEEELNKPKKKELSFEAKMNRKIGKYDYEDPFIDDAELLWDEQQVSTKDGFFVYYGPLFEEGQNVRIEKLDNKRNGSSNGSTAGRSGTTQRSANGTLLSVNGKPIGNPHRGSNGRFTVLGQTPLDDTAKSLIAIQPKSRGSTPAPIAPAPVT